MDHAESAVNVMYPTVPFMEAVEDITDLQAVKVREGVMEYLNECYPEILPPPIKTPPSESGTPAPV